MTTDVASAFTRHVASVAEGQRAMQTHAVDCAWRAAAEYGPGLDLPSLEKLLKDPRFVRYPVRIAFAAQGLQPGEMAFAEKVGDSSSEGFVIWVHPTFEGRNQDLVRIIAYQLVTVNYGEVATHEEAELFGATLLNMDRELYYQALCSLSDEVGG